jgi:Zn-dependent metalloprotease
MCRNRNPIQCVIAPYIFEKLAQSQDSKVRERAFHTMQFSARIRGHRDILGGITIPHTLLGTKSTATGLKRTVYTCALGTQLPGTKVRGEGDTPSGDKAADEAYEGLGATYNLYKNVFGRTSLDDNGLPLIASVQYGQQYDNAEWNGQQMLFGDGDGTYFNRFTIAVDVIGHELTHGVTQYTCGLNYHDQCGALNESFSDVFGSMVKQYSLKQTAASADWLLGQGLLTSIVKSGDPSHGPALRSMLKPGTAFDDPTFGKDPQPDNMSGYVQTQSDYGGVHTNSSIPNRAFALAARNLGGYSWEGAGQIWYKTLLRLQPESQFQDAANLTYQIAGEDPFGSGYQKAVQDAWGQVGIRVGGAAPTTAAAVPAGVPANLEARLAGIEEQLKKLTEMINVKKEEIKKDKPQTKPKGK